MDSHRTADATEETPEQMDALAPMVASAQPPIPIFTPNQNHIGHDSVTGLLAEDVASAQHLGHRLSLKRHSVQGAPNPDDRQKALRPTEMSTRVSMGPSYQSGTHADLPRQHVQTLFERKLKGQAQQSHIWSEEQWKCVRDLRFNEQICGGPFNEQICGQKTRSFEDLNNLITKQAYSNKPHGYRHIPEVRCRTCRVHIDKQAAQKYVEHKNCHQRWGCPRCHASRDQHILVQRGNGRVYTHQSEVFEIMYNLYQQCHPKKKRSELNQLDDAFRTQYANGKKVHAELFLKAWREAGDATKRQIFSEQCSGQGRVSASSCGSERAGAPPIAPPPPPHTRQAQAAAMEGSDRGDDAAGASVFVPSREDIPGEGKDAGQQDDVGQHGNEVEEQDSAHAKADTPGEMRRGRSRGRGIKKKQKGYKFSKPRCGKGAAGVPPVNVEVTVYNDAAETRNQPVFWAAAAGGAGVALNTSSTDGPASRGATGARSIGQPGAEAGVGIGEAGMSLDLARSVGEDRVQNAADGPKAGLTTGAGGDALAVDSSHQAEGDPGPLVPESIFLPKEQFPILCKEADSHTTSSLTERTRPRLDVIKDKKSKNRQSAVALGARSEPGTGSKRHASTAEKPVGREAPGGWSGGRVGSVSGTRAGVYSKRAAPLTRRSGDAERTTAAAGDERVGEDASQTRKRSSSAGCCRSDWSSKMSKEDGITTKLSFTMRATRAQVPWNWWACSNQ